MRAPGSIPSSSRLAGSDVNVRLVAATCRIQGGPVTEKQVVLEEMRLNKKTIDRIVQKCLAKDPKQRYPDALLLFVDAPSEAVPREGALHVRCTALHKSALFWGREGPPGVDQQREIDAEKACKSATSAEGEGFEPSVDRKAHNGFRDRPVQPLRHPSRCEALQG